MDNVRENQTYPQYKLLSNQLPVTISKLLLRESNRLPQNEEADLIRDQLKDDAEELAFLNARMDKTSSKVKERRAFVEDLSLSIKLLQDAQELTATQLRNELEAESSLERLSRGFITHLNTSAVSAELMRINSESHNKSHAILASSIQELRKRQEMASERLRYLRDSLQLEYACLGLLLDQRSSLEKRQNELFHSIEKKRSLVGPLRRLPTETLIQIFGETLELVIQDRIRLPLVVVVHPTLAISSVCRRWRDIALATPGLWRYLPIYDLPSLDTIQLPMPTATIYERAGNPTNLFVDWTRSVIGHRDDSMRRWAHVLSSMALSPVANSTMGPHTSLTAHYSGEVPTTLNIRFFKLQHYTFHNLYPNFTRAAASHVTSLVLHFPTRPKIGKVQSILEQLHNLSTLEIYMGRHYSRRHSSVFFPTLPFLRILVSPLSMLPTFLDAEQAVPRALVSLKVGYDNIDLEQLLPRNWTPMVEATGLATSLRHLALEGATSSLNAGAGLPPLFVGLSNVVTLALDGPYMSPVLDALTHDSTLLPSLSRLEMSRATVACDDIRVFIDSRSNSRPAGAAPNPIRELVFSHCPEFTQAFCEEIRQKVDTLTVYL